MLLLHASDVFDPDPDRLGENFEKATKAISEIAGYIAYFGGRLLIDNRLPAPFVEIEFAGRTFKLTPTTGFDFAEFEKLFELETEVFDHDDDTETSIRDDDRDCIERIVYFWQAILEESRLRAVGPPTKS